MKIRSAQPQDFAAILALNQASVAVLSPMNHQRLAQLHDQAALHWVVEPADREAQIAAFLLAFREGSPYNSINYQWFAQRYDQFIYIDRIVVAQGQRGLGIGRALYRKIFTYAQDHHLPQVTCEIDIEPPNHNSQRFHQQLGFRTIGRQANADGTKQVAFQTLEMNGVEAV